MNRAVAVNRQWVVSFTDGVPISVKHVKPSELKAVATLPADLVGAYLDGVLQAFTDQEGVLDKEKGVLEARAEVLKAQAALLKARRGLRRSSPGAA